MTIDIEKLREDLKQECYSAYFGGGFARTLTESCNLERASPEELVEKVIRKCLFLFKPF